MIFTEDSWNGLALSEEISLSIHQAAFTKFV